MDAVQDAPAVSASAHQTWHIVTDAREAQASWRRTSVSERLRVIRRLRSSVAESALELCKLFSPDLPRTSAESLTAEIIPLAEACKFLERRAGRILSPRRLGTRSSPLWLRGVGIEVHREPLGVVLIIGPANYPLFLPGVQALQALVAGNAVLLKPGRGGWAVAQALRSMAVQAGAPPALFAVVDESVQTAEQLIRIGVDKIVLTGSVESGRSVYRQSADSLTPATLELSGADPVFIQSSADIGRAIKAIVFGLKLNGGMTCIAPHRIYVAESVASSFEEAFSREAGIFARGVSITRVRNDEEALRISANSAYALGATVFGEPSAAQALAEKINAGVVVINDMIVPTADPRVPFGGRRLSGFGVTRGAEGLLEFTVIKAVVVQRSKRLRHLERLPANAEQLFAAYLKAAHTSGWRSRLSGWRSAMAAAARSRQKG